VLSICFALIANASLLNEPLSNSAQNDFFSFFDFKEQTTMPGSSGLTEHIYTSNMGCILDLGVDGSNTIKHMQLVMPRQMIDSEKYGIAARDIAKSFILAVPTNHLDGNELKQLSDEVYVRELDLHPVEVGTKTFADSGKPIPKKMYKVGTGPVQVGDRLMAIDKLPVLAAQASQMYDTFAGRKPFAGMVLSECRLKFENGKTHDKNVLLLEAWDEPFWQANNAPEKVKPRSTEMQKAIEKARELQKTGKSKEVIALLRPLNEKEAGDLDCLTILGTAFEESGNHADAQAVLLEAMQAANRQKSDNADLHFIACKSFIGSGKLSSAMEECLKVDKLAPNNAKQLLGLGEILVKSGDPVLSNFALRNFNRAESLGLKDYRIPAMQALAAYQMGKQKEGLGLLKKAIEGITPESSHATFLQEMKRKANSIESNLRTRPAAPVPAKDRKYEMSSGTTSVIAEKDEANGTITMGIMGGHDPDGGKQDGCDDGIIEFNWKNITQPSEIYRPKQ
jgi:hypothetical protein